MLLLPPTPPPEPDALHAIQQDPLESLEQFLARARLKQGELFAKLGKDLEALVQRLEALTLPPTDQARDGLVDECVALGSEATPLFVRWLDVGDASLEKERFRARQLAAALARMDTRAATADLLNLLAKGTTEGRILAARVLETSPERERVRPALNAAFQSSNGQLREALARALLRLWPEDPKLLDDVFNGEDDALCAVALGVITEAKNAAAEERVRRLLGDEARSTKHALWILGYYQAMPELVSIGHAKELIALASNSKLPIATRLAIIDALPLFVTNSSNDLKKALDPLLNGADLKLSESVLVVLARLGDRAAKKDLLKPYDDLVDNTPRWSQAFARRADVLRRIGDYREAERDYVKALELGRNDPNPQPETYIGLARCASLQGHFKEAAKWLQQAPIQIAMLKALGSDPDFLKLKSSKYGDVFPGS